jgi:hypothetical protein
VRDNKGLRTSTVRDNKGLRISIVRDNKGLRISTARDRDNEGEKIIREKTIYLYMIIIMTEETGSGGRVM